MKSNTCYFLLLAFLFGSGCEPKKPENQRQMTINPQPVNGARLYIEEEPTKVKALEQKATNLPTNEDGNTTQPEVTIEQENKTETIVKVKSAGTETIRIISSKEKGTEEHFKSVQVKEASEKKVELKKVMAHKKSGGYKPVSFETLSGFEYEIAGGYGGFLGKSRSRREFEIPNDIKALHGEPVIVEGYMLPIHFDKGKTHKFMVMGFQVGCCFGGIPRLNEWVVVSMEGQKAVDVLPSYVRCRVYGIMEVEKQKDKEDHFESLYRMQAIKVQELKAQPDHFQSGSGGSSWK